MSMSTETVDRNAELSILRWGALAGSNHAGDSGLMKPLAVVVLGEVRLKHFRGLASPATPPEPKAGLHRLLKPE